MESVWQHILLSTSLKINTRPFNSNKKNNELNACKQVLCDKKVTVEYTLTPKNVITSCDKERKMAYFLESLEDKSEKK